MPFEIPSTSSLAICTGLLRGVGHRLRTPLSVVMNDLTYLLTTGADEESCKRGMHRLREASSLLRDLTQELESAKQLTDVQLEKELEDLFLESAIEFLPESLNAHVSVPALRKGIEFFLARFSEEKRGGRAKLISADRALHLEVSGNERGVPVGEYFSFSEIEEQAGSGSDFEAPFHDLLLLTQNIRVSLSVAESSVSMILIFHS